MTSVVRSAWKEALLKLLNRGVPLTEATSRCRVGASMVNQERRRDPVFKKAYDIAKGITDE